MLENDLDMIDLVLTHLNQPLNLGDPWRPLATIGDMPENGQMVAKGRQGSRGTPGLVEMS